MAIHKESLDPSKLLSFDDPSYVEPAPEDVRLILKNAGLTHNDAGRLVGVSARTVRRWVGGEADIPYAAWRSLLVYVGEVGPQLLPWVVFMDGPTNGIPNSLSITGRRYATKYEAKGAAEWMVEQRLARDAVAAFRPDPVTLELEPPSIRELRKREQATTDAYSDPLQAVRAYADRHHDGHYTLYSFTTNYKLLFGTMLGGDYLAMNQRLQAIPGAQTIADACANALANPELHTATT